LDSFANYLAQNGVPLDADAIDRWARGESDAARHSRPNWGDLFRAAEAERWTRIERYLGSRGVTLVESPPDAAVSAAVDQLLALLNANSDKSKTPSN